MKKRDLLIQLFGDRSQTRILNFILTEMSFFDYSITDIAKLTGVTKPTVYAIFPIFEKMGLVKKTREVGNAIMYVANKDSPIYKSLQKFILESYAEEKGLEEVLA